MSADRCGSPRKEREAQVTAKEDAGHRERSDEVWVTAKEYEVLPKKRGAGAGAGQLQVHVHVTGHRKCRRCVVEICWACDYDVMSNIVH